LKKKKKKEREKKRAHQYFSNQSNNKKMSQQIEIESVIHFPLEKEKTAEEILLEKREKEKRVRHQLYTALDYHLNLTSDINFYSEDAFSILEASQSLARELEEDEISVEMFLLAFFLVKAPHLSILKASNVTFQSFQKELFACDQRLQKKMTKYQIHLLEEKFKTKTISELLYIGYDEEVLLDMISYYLQYQGSKYPLIMRISPFLKTCRKKFRMTFYKIKKYGRYLDNLIDRSLLQLKLIKELPKEDSCLDYAYQVETILTLASEAALKRFKTPIITSDILFLVLLEYAWKDKTRNLFPKLVQKKTDYLLLRYQLLKQLHNQESSLRNQIPKNQQFFAYLLKTQLPEKMINEFLANENYEPHVSLFRDELMKKVAKVDLQKLLYQETLANIDETSIRVYSKNKQTLNSEDIEILWS